MLTLKELSSQTGLTENVIRKHMRLLGSFLKPYIKRGESNKLLFDPNCVVVFNEIKKLKAEGKTAKEITAFFKDVYSAAKDISYHKISPGQTDQTEEPTPQIEELYRMLLAEKDKRIHEIDKRDLKIVRLEIKNVKLQESVKLLPDGKKPAKIRKEKSSLPGWRSFYELGRFKLLGCCSFFEPFFTARKAR